MKYNFSKIYIYILTLWIPFYFFWEWLRFSFTGDPSDGIRYVLEVFYIGLVLLILSSIFLAIKNKFLNLWDYVVFLIAMIILFLTKGLVFLVSYL